MVIDGGENVVIIYEVYEIQSVAQAVALEPGLIEASPIVFFKVDKGLKICLHCAILLFCLSVCLRMERGGKSPFDFEEIKK